jgi:hypothetical protein
VSEARRIGYHLSSEQFAAGRLVANAVAATTAGSAPLPAEPPASDPGRQPQDRGR